MKVLHVFNELKFSGAEIMYVDSASIFKNLGCKLSVLSTSENMGEYAETFKNEGFGLFHIPYFNRKNIFHKIKFGFKFLRLVRDNHFKVIHIHSNRLFWLASIVAWLSGVKSIYTFHNNFYFSGLPYYVQLIKRWSAKVIFKCKFHSISDSVYENELLYFRNHTNKIYNWYNNKRFYPAEKVEREKIRKELGISDKSLVIISIGGCSEIKRHSEIIQAIPHILGEVKDVLYLHLGKGEIENNEINLVKKLKIDNKVRFCGNQKNVRKFLVASDIYIMPSRYEGIPLTTIEAMACKIPAILYNVPGLKDFNKNGENSMLIPEDYHAIAKSVLTMYSNPKNFSSMIENAKTFVDNNFLMENNAKKIFDLYNS